MHSLAMRPFAIRPSPRRPLILANLLASLLVPVWIGDMPAALEAAVPWLVLEHGNVRAAVALYGKMLQVGDGIHLGRDDLLAVVKGLHQQQQWAASAAFLQELIRRFPDGADLVRIKLAQICVMELQMPAGALELLGEVDFAHQAVDKRELAKKIARRAQHRQAEGVYELDNEPR